jgi:TrmH family RNA methyltransferase
MGIMISKSEAKYIQSLGHKKPREEAGVFIAEGPKLLHELLTSAQVKIRHIYATAAWIENNQIYTKEIPITEVSDEALKKISHMTTPHEVLAVVEKMHWGDHLSVKNKITLALDTIQDPGNLGTIIRTADWFGVEQMVCSPDCADLYNPKVVQATMGSIVRVKVFYRNLAEWLALQKKEVRMYAAVLDGKDMAAIGKLQEGILVIGNESKGIREEILKQTDVKITIPKKGKAESLNAAVATGVLLSRLI